MMKRILALLLALAMLLSVQAVFAEGETEAADTSPAQLLATVNGQEIYEDDPTLQSYVNSYLEEIEADTEHRMELIHMYAMERTIKSMLINQRAQAVVTEEKKAAYIEQAKSEWAEIIEEYVTEHAGIAADAPDEEKAAARAEALSLLEAQGWTEDLYVEQDAEYLAYNDYLNGIAETLTSDPALAATEEEIQEAFNELVEEDRANIEGNPVLYEFYPQFFGKNPFYVPEGYRGITHILLSVDQALLDTWTDLNARFEESDEAADEAVDAETPAPEAGDPAPAEETAETPAPTEEPVTQEMIDQAEKAILDSVADKLAEIKQKLEAGALFEDLIAEYGTDPGMQDANYLKSGYPVHKDSMMYDPVFTAAANKLEKVGDVGDPVVTQFGVHILHYLRDIPSGAVEMTDEIRADLILSIESEKQNDAFMDMLDTWVEEAEIIYTEAGLAWKYDEDLINAYAEEEDEEEDESSEDEEGEDEDEDEDEEAEETEEAGEDETDETDEEDTSPASETPAP